MSEVFVSYKAEDRARVAPLVGALEAHGHNVWWDAQIGGGEEWRDEIASHLEAAGCVIVVWSKRSVGKDGRFVREEATRALKRGTYLPIRIDRVDPPLGFGETQALSLFGWKGDPRHPQFAAIENAVSAMLGRAGKAPALVSEGLARRPLLLGGSAAIAAAAVGGWWLLKPDEARANSIAVLPFANLSGDPAQEYFSDGMAEELRSALSQIAGLQVVARTSSEMLRDSDAKSAARKLGVEHILSGSVRRSPSTIRVNAQLVDGENGLERWSDSFDKPAGDLLEVQTSIARSVAQALRIELGGASQTLTVGGTSNPAALDLYLRANPGQQPDDKAGLETSIGLLDSAIAIDPDFAHAHARRGFIMAVIAGVYSLSPAEADRRYELALKAVERAVAIEPRLAVAFATRGSILRDRLNMSAALASLEKADRLPGADAHALRLYAMVLGQIGRFQEAQRKIAESKALDPLNPVSSEVEALLFAYARNYPAAERSARESLLQGSNRFQPRRILANSLLLMGKTDEAAAEYAKIDANDYRRLLGEALIAARAGDRAKALQTRAVMEQRYGDFAQYQYAEIYAQLGMRDEALAALRRAVEVRDPGMSIVRVDPFLDPLRSDPRFAGLEAKLNFPASS